MIKEIIYYLYNKTTKGKHHMGFVRFLIRLFANVIVYPLSWYTPKLQNTNAQIIVSLTSFPGRINQVWKVLIPLLHQRTTEPYKIILWLSKEQFCDWMSIPRKLRKLAEKGLEIRFKEDDLKSHKKYFYAFNEYPQCVVITVDDDILYSLDLVQTLMNAHLESPDMICCCRGRQVIFDENNVPLNYSKWNIYSSTTSATVCNQIVPTGIGGILYPPGSYSKEIFDKDVFKRTCLHGDDLWLNFMCRLQGTYIKHITNKFRYNSLFFSQKGSLSKSNVKLNKNDEQIKLISKWALQQFHCDFFYRMNS